MNLGVRTMSFVALLGMVLIGLGQYRPAWAVQAGLDWWNLPELCEQVRRGEEKLAAQEPRGRAMVERFRARGAVTEELRAGRLTLVQAAARFRNLNAYPPDSVPDLRHYVPGATDEERLCRQVIFWAEGSDPAMPLAARKWTRRQLEAELDRLLAENNGIIRLPE
jgi:hypothetical protein